jgi:hypothetical protein
MTQNVVAVASNLPITELETARRHYKFLAALQGKKMRIRYRGPRYDSMRLTCLKRNARAFSVYFD